MDNSGIVRGPWRKTQFLREKVIISDSDTWNLKTFETSKLVLKRQKEMWD